MRCGCVEGCGLGNLFLDGNKLKCVMSVFCWVMFLNPHEGGNLIGVLLSRLVAGMNNKKCPIKKGAQSPFFICRKNCLDVKSKVHYITISHYIFLAF